MKLSKPYLSKEKHRIALFHDIVMTCHSVKL